MIKACIVPSIMKITKLNPCLHYARVTIQTVLWFWLWLCVERKNYVQFWHRNCL